ncbi:SagB/ThcOx family dehydrogenase [Clostridium saccharoperbutylacetonicum]|uniref:SagB/ThcOx family dehydrogenase n=1 Tax=Clostridium saccharoperbutylacetonicum TaxID=36745 RepID=UPI0039E7FE52
MEIIYSLESSKKNDLSLAKDYHESTKLHLSGINMNYCKEFQYKVYANTTKIKLVNLDSECENDFIKCMTNRKSTREFTTEGITLKNISYILSLCYGLNKKSDIEFRTVPSAGARFPLELYLVVLNSIDLEQGVYHFDIKNNQLEKIKSGNYKNEIGKYCNNQDFVSNSSVVIIMTTVFERNMEKYGERGYRYILLDAGHVGQNMYLAATYLGLGAVTIGGFNDDKINQLIGVDGIDETSIYIGVVGSI